ncbi:20S pre-rrna processing of protein [Pseudohyphozyma bogoriensis]|nr:20S pre-rrna processing of protein [Pseudohyphozyma bogoriensis]
MQASASTAPAAPAPTPEEVALLTFARATINLLTFWPALRIAITQGWGSAEGRTHLAEDIVDLFYTTAVESTSTKVPDIDDVTSVVLHVLSKEFSVSLEDDSERLIANDLTHLWKECLERAEGTWPAGREGRVEVFERQAEKARVEDAGSGGYQGARRDGQSDDEGSVSDEDSSEDEDEEMEVESAPAPRVREEPVIDEDGFQMVTKGKRR